ncbi:MAG TPA: hypothetical protein VFV66_06055 [Nonomuraea sp.]|nr:hypothetical protein [Nonomuraea sp.]
MYKKILAATLMSLSLSVGLAGAAHATTQSENETQADAGTMAIWHYYNYYLYLSDCEYTGRYLVSTGQYKAWDCVRIDHNIWKWGLRVLD